MTHNSNLSIDSLAIYVFTSHTQDPSTHCLGTTANAVALNARVSLGYVNPVVHKVCHIIAREQRGVQVDENPDGNSRRNERARHVQINTNSTGFWVPGR
jgi:hypothetical protein